VTKQNGTAQWDAAAGEWDFTLKGTRYANRNPLLRRPRAAAALEGRGGASRTLDDDEAVTEVVVQTFGRDGLLNATRTVQLPSAGSAVEISLVPGQVAVVAFAARGH
jgi:hypothetical protein